MNDAIFEGIKSANYINIGNMSDDVVHVVVSDVPRGTCFLSVFNFIFANDFVIGRIRIEHFYIWGNIYPVNANPPIVGIGLRFLSVFTCSNMLHMETLHWINSIHTLLINKLVVFDQCISDGAKSWKIENKFIGILVEWSSNS